MTPGSYGDLEAWIEFRPAHYCMGEGVKCPSCDAGHKGDHGRGSTKMYWYLRGHDMAVQFVVITGWLATVDPYAARPIEPWGTMPTDIGCHSSRPWYEGMYPRNDCHLLKGACYYDGSGLNAEEGWKLLRDEGSEAVWSWMHDYFTRWAGERAEFERAGVGS